MTYKFKSKVTGDLVMLEADGRRLLQIIGKEAGPTGILVPGEMAAAVQALRAAIATEEARHGSAGADAKPAVEPAPADDAVSLRQRALPFIDMLVRCEKENADVVWGV